MTPALPGVVPIGKSEHTKHYRARLTNPRLTANSAPLPGADVRFGMMKWLAAVAQW